MRKIIWIYGGHATGKSTAANMLQTMISPEISLNVSQFMINYENLKTFAYKNILQLLIIDEFNKEYKLDNNTISELIEVSKVMQVIILSHHPVIAELKDHVIQLKAE